MMYTVPTKIASPKSNAAIGFALVFLGALGFSVKSILIKFAYKADHEIDVISLMALRMLFALPFFLIIALWQHRKTDSQPLNSKQWLIIIVLGLMGYYLASYLDFAGLQYISAGLERVILFLYPTFVIVFSAVLYRRPISIRQLIALILSYAGLVLIFIAQLSLQSPKLLLGAGLILGSAIIFACFTMGSGIMVHKIGSTRFTAYTMMVASMATLTHFSLQQKISLNHFQADIYYLTLIMAVFSTVLPAFFMNAGIRRIGAGSASIISSTGPVVTLMLAYMLLDEAISGFQLIGTLLVLTGVYIISKAKP
jgi:drug/metabolite transporter (DMT)-like permease